MNDLEDVEPGDEGRTYREKSYWARLRVVLAGPAMNFLIAFVLLVVLFAGLRPGRPTRTGRSHRRVTGRARPPRASCKGDRLVSIDGQPVGDFDRPSQGIEQTGPATPSPRGRSATASQGHAHPDRRLDPRPPRARPSSAAVQAGDQILAVNGLTVHDLRRSCATPLADAPKGDAKVVLLERDGNVYTTTVSTPVDAAGRAVRTGFLGIAAGSPDVRLGPIQAVGTAGHEFASLVGGSIRPLGHFFSPAGLTNWTHTVLTNKAPADGERRRRPAGRSCRSTRTPRRPTVEPAGAPSASPRTTTGCCRSSACCAWARRPAGGRRWPWC